jgi:hypothetical protein
LSAGRQNSSIDVHESESRRMEGKGTFNPQLRQRLVYNDCKDSGVRKMMKWCGSNCNEHTVHLQVASQERKGEGRINRFVYPNQT